MRLRSSFLMNRQRSNAFDGQDHLDQQIGDSNSLRQGLIDSFCNFNGISVQEIDKYKFYKDQLKHYMMSNKCYVGSADC